MSGAGQPVETWFREGVAAARSGRRARARDLFRRVVQVDEEHCQAWLWLAGVADGEEQQACVARVQALSGDHRPAAWSSGTELLGPARPQAAGREARAPERQAAGRLLEAIWPALAALGILSGIALAELMATLVDPRLGLGLHCLILVLLLVEVALAEAGALQDLFLALTLVPLIRILSLSLPLAHVPILYWYPIIGVPLLAAVWVAARSLGYSWRALGLTLRGWPLQLAVGLSGLALGVVEYAILRPPPLTPAPAWAHAWLPALILLVCTGLLEEMVFRGLLQYAAAEALGRWGMPYVALLFAVMHTGYRSPLNAAFVLAVGLFFGAVVQRTRSLLGVAMAHGLTNIVLFLVMPLVAG